MTVEETQNIRSRMRLAIGAFVGAAFFAVMALRGFGARNNWLFAGAVLSAGLCVVTVAWAAGLWWRDRQRKRLTDMRDSALW